MSLFELLVVWETCLNMGLSILLKKKEGKFNCFSFSLYGCMLDIVSVCYCVFSCLYFGCVFF